MKILYLAPKIPWPATDGSRIALYELIRHMTARGHQAALLGFGKQESADEFRTRAGLVWARAIEHNTKTNYLNAALRLLSPTPYTVSKYRSGAMASAIRAAFTRSDSILFIWKAPTWRIISAWRKAWARQRSCGCKMWNGCSRSVSPGQPPSR